MLVLKRYIDESIVINKDIEIKILNIQDNGQIILGIKADKNISVHRKEIQDLIDNTQKPKPIITYRKKRIIKPKEKGE